MRRLPCACTVMLLLGSIGCVSQADYDQLMAQNKSLLAEKEAYADRALNAESQSEALRNQLLTKERELEVQKSLTASLQDQYDNMHAAFQNSQDILSKVDLNPDRPLVIQTTLPPELDKALKNFAASHPAIEYDPARGAVKWTSDLLFASGSDVIRQDAASTLRSFADIVNSTDAAGFDVVVVGHTDTDPIVHSKTKHPTNWHLSAHRSIAVARELINAQLAPERVGIMGYSQYRPVATNDTEQGKSQNRRVEIFIVGHQELVTDTVPLNQSKNAQAAPLDVDSQQK